MKKLLLIAFQFPPANFAGVYRPLYFVKHLRQFGIEPIVVTIDKNSIQQIAGNKIDESLLNPIPNDINIYRIPCSPPPKQRSSKMIQFLDKFMSITDPHASRWRDHFIPQLDEIIEKQAPDCIYVTLPPFSIGKLMIEVRKKHNIPLIVDLRDSMTNWGNTIFASRLHYQLTKKLENKIFEIADVVITVTKELKEILEKTHDNIKKEKIQVIPNGFNKNDNTEIFPPKTYLEIPPISKKKEFIIGYVGSFYYQPDAQETINKKWWQRERHRKIQYSPQKEDWLYRSPFFFLQALAKLRIEKPEIGSKIKFHYAGDEPEWLRKMICEFGLSDIFHSYGLLKYQEVLKVQQSFDAFLATSEKVIGGNHYCLPSKLFDYILQGKPIIGFLTNGTQKKFLQQSGVAIIINPDDQKQSLCKLEEAVSGGYKLYPNVSFLEQYHRRNLTGALANIVKGIAPDY